MNCGRVCVRARAWLGPDSSLPVGRHLCVSAHLPRVADSRATRGPPGRCQWLTFRAECSRGRALAGGGVPWGPSAGPCVRVIRAAGAAPAFSRPHRRLRPRPPAPSRSLGSPRRGRSLKRAAARCAPSAAWCVEGSRCLGCGLACARASLSLQASGALSPAPPGQLGGCGDRRSRRGLQSSSCRGPGGRYFNHTNGAPTEHPRT